MTITAMVNRYFDRYSIVARLFPALIFVAPIFLAAITVFPKLLSGYRNPSLLGLTMVGMLYFIASLARSRGKIVQADMLARWGGWPSTIFLRDRDRTIDSNTKARYHRALEKMVGQSLFTEADEQVDPVKADHAYRSATKLLIEKRRGKKYLRVHEENASFGFRRNLLGLKVPAVIIALVCAVMTTLAWVVINQPLDAQTIQVSIVSHPAMPGLVVADLLYAAALLWGVNGRFLRQAGNEYAFALYRTLEPTNIREKRSVTAPPAQRWPA